MTRLYRWLLRLLPAGRRSQHGEEMRTVFARVLQQARAEGRSTVPVWIAEAKGLLKYGARERIRPPALELRLAWRGLRARGWRALIAVALLAVAIGANTIMFTVADALLFRPTTYRDSDRVVQLMVETGGFTNSRPIPARALDEWRQQTDVFEGVEVYLRKIVFLVGQGVPELVQTADISPGLTALLGVQPRWGRPLTAADAAETSPMPVLISEELARARFGTPLEALNKQLATAAEPLLVAGVMDASFRFPSGTQKIWRPLDLAGPLAAGYSGGFPIARLAQRATPAAATALLVERYKQEGRRLTAGQGTPRLITLDDTHRSRIGPSTLWFMLAAAVCLLATACANIASLELATAITRTRTWAIHRALGASRLAIARIAVWEGLWMLLLSVAAASLIAWAGVKAAATWLPEQLSLSAVNPFDIDARAVTFMAAVAATTWIITTLPTVLYASRRDTVDLLKADARGSSSRAGARMRQALTAAQVAIAVLLLASGVLAARNYLSMLNIDKGFDSRSVLQVMLTIPPQDIDRIRPAEARLRETLASVPGVLGVTTGMAPPSSGDSPMPMTIRIDGRPDAIEVMVSRKSVEPDYFSVIGLPMLDGSAFAHGEHDTSIVVSDRLTRRLGLDGRAVGARILLYERDQWRTISGVVRHVPGQNELLAVPDDASYQVYAPSRPPVPRPTGAPSAAQTARFAGPAYAVAALVVRADSPARAADILAAVRRTEPAYAAKVTRADDNYAQFFSRTRLIRQITMSFGLLAFIVAIAGIYGVMSYIVAGRRKEFGIRVALGARRADIRRLVFRSSMTMVLAGAVLGLAGAVTVSRWAGSTIFGIQTYDPAVLGGIGILVAGAALAAAWRPAEAAAGSNPVVLLRD